MEQYPNLNISVSSITINGIDGFALSSVPGISPHTLILIAANNRVYQVRYYGENFDNIFRDIVKDFRFISPNVSLTQLDLPSSKDVLYLQPPDEIIKQLEQIEESSKHDDIVSSHTDFQDVESSELNIILSLQSGCTTDSQYVQTQWNRYASGGTGNSYAGSYFWGQGGHIRCNSTGSYNNYYALDHALNEWDPIYPHRSGTIIFAGWASGGWSTLGRMVIIDYGNNRWGVMAHLRSLSYAAFVGNYVTSNTHIGYAGGSGNSMDNFWSIHLHQSLHLDAILVSSGGIYGGQSARPDAISHTGGIYNHGSMSGGMLMRYRPGG